MVVLRRTFAGLCDGDRVGVIRRQRIVGRSGSVVAMHAGSQRIRSGLGHVKTAIIHPSSKVCPREAQLVDDRNITIDRVAAIPFLTAEQPVSLIVVTRRSGEWILPRGKNRDGTQPHVMAGIEAFEEAGAIGRIAPDPVGRYEIMRRGRRMAVDAYPMLVDHLLYDWPERSRRARHQVPFNGLDVFPLSEGDRALIERARETCIRSADAFVAAMEDPAKILRRWRVAWSAA